jgi:hypothetical protein
MVRPVVVVIGVALLVGSSVSGTGIAIASTWLRGIRGVVKLGMILPK